MIKILSIDGGGSRGVIPATILDCIYRETGQSPVEIFDLIAGTSTGGILSIGYANGISTGEMVELFLEKSRDIFHDSIADNVHDFGKNIGADFSNDRLKKILKTLFGNQTLGDTFELLGTEKDLMVCTFHLNPHEDGRPVNFKPIVYHSGFLRDKDLKLVDLALRHSAAPTYFPIYQTHVDGGVALNNPVMAAIAFAINKRTDGTNHFYPDGKKRGMGRKLSDIKLLSLGTGTSNKDYITPKKIGKGDWGNLQWIRYLPDLLIESNMQTSLYYVDQLLDDKQYMRVQLYFDREETPEIIKDKVIGPDTTRKDLLLAMVAYAEEYFKKNKKDILELLGLG